jgi:serine/threonine-protein kinase
MAENLPDEVLAHALQQMGIVSFDQLEAAQLEQTQQAKQGATLSLGDMLILQNVITPATLENVVKKVQARAAGGIRQLGPYKLTKKLGEGGMGQVFLAEDTHVGRTVAIKVLLKKFADDHQFLTRFRREAIATGKLNHVNIVCAYTVGEEQGVHYYVMEHCDGEPLDKLLKRAPFIPWEMACGIIMQVARGLKHAHEHGIIHRDIKPENVFICRPPGTAGVSPADGQDGRAPLDILGEGYVAKILDLGLSKDLGNESSSFYTQTGVAMGTPHYISPEQAKGEKQIDGRTDIYSLGATFYHLVTGQTPFTGTTPAIVMMKHLTGQLPNPQDVNDEIPDGVVHIIQRMMAKDAVDRYANCKELLEDLELVIDGKMPSSQAIEFEKTSIAKALRHGAAGVSSAGGQDGRGPGARASLPSGQAGKPGLPPPRGTSRHDPVGVRPAGAVEQRSGRGRESAEPSAPGPANKALICAGIGVGVLVLVGVLTLTMGGGEKPATTGATGDKTKAIVTPGGPVLPPPPALPGVTEATVPADQAESKALDNAWIKSVQAQPPEEQVKRVVEKLKELNPGYSGKEKHRINGNAVESLDIGAGKMSDLSPVRALVELRGLICDGTKLSDLSALKGLRLEDLTIYWGPVSDLSPLRGMPLQRLLVCGLPVRDLSPLEGMPLKRLDVVQSRIRDLSPLIGMPLQYLNIQATAVTDFSPLKDLPLINLSGDFVLERDVAILRSIKTLERINDKPVAEFWSKYPDAGSPKPVAGGWPLHDGKEPIADYAKRVGLPETETLDLGGGVKMELVLVPAGEFMMGGNDGGRSEKPVHKVRIGQPFYLGKYEVTVAQFRTFAAAAPYRTEAERVGAASTWLDRKSDVATKMDGANWKTPGFPQEDNHPACAITWDDAQAFCTWAATLTRRTARLPSEAQWEYACRAGTVSSYNTGYQHSDLNTSGWWNGNSDMHTAAVGRKKPNAWGLYDMHGNVWEWCEDYFNERYYEAAPRDDPQGPPNGRDRVQRGGGFNNQQGPCRSASRGFQAANSPIANLGFRVVAGARSNGKSGAMQPETTNQGLQTAVDTPER